MSFDPAEFEPFRCEVDPDRESVIVRPVGALDLATVPIVDAQLAELVAAAFRASCSTSASCASWTPRA